MAFAGKAFMERLALGIFHDETMEGGASFQLAVAATVVGSQAGSLRHYGRQWQAGGYNVRELIAGLLGRRVKPKVARILSF